MVLEGDDPEQAESVEDRKYGWTIIAAGRHHQCTALVDRIKGKWSALHTAEKHERTLK
jgi:hypothetical protein